jgi:hypothetical protein
VLGTAGLEVSADRQEVSSLGVGVLAHIRLKAEPVVREIERTLQREQRDGKEVRFRSGSTIRSSVGTTSYKPILLGRSSATFAIGIIPRPTAPRSTD